MSLPQLVNQIKSAGFRHIQTGRIYPTGSFHDLNQVPEDIDIEQLEDGFITHDGDFVDRKTATQMLKLNRPVQSEELELGKSLKEYVFSSPQLENNHYKITASHNDKPIGEFTFWANPVGKGIHQGYHKVGGTHVSVVHRGKGINGQMMQIAAKFIKEKLGNKGLVSEGPWREDAATRSWLGMSKRIKGVKKIPNPQEPDLFDFRLSLEEEMNLKKSQDNDAIKHEFKVKFKDWLRKHKLIKKDLFEDSSVNCDDMIESIEDTPEYKAAMFLTGGMEPDEDVLREALIIWDHDIEFAVLLAFGIHRTEKNRKQLRSVMKISEMTKSDMEVAIIPRIVKPVFEEGKAVADIIQEAFKEGRVKSVNLKGKHSKGVAVAWDKNKVRKFLLKPGSGKLSPAAGVREDSVNQSRREVAFSKISSVLGLGEYVPEAELLDMDHNEVAAIRLLTGSYVNFEKRKRTKHDVSKVLDKYKENGDLFKWTVLDYVLGNIDCHMGNGMVNDFDKVKLIDHGSSFAGEAFTPLDLKTFTPFYLRYMSDKSFSQLNPIERYEIMPKPTFDIEDMVGQWIENWDINKVEFILKQYQINPKPVLERINILKKLEINNRLKYVLHWWAGTHDPRQTHEF